MKPITEETKFVIGIDFGHGETSACYCALHNEEGKDSMTDLDILPGLPVIPSAVAIMEQQGEETICVGSDARENAPLAVDFQVSFKKRPSEMDDQERKRMTAFMKGVYEGILDINPGYKDTDHRVCIARPSQDKLWKNEEAAYVAMAEEAGLPVADIQKESRAAYFRARTKADSPIDNQAEKGVLIVDYGSSTIDFTYLNRDLQKPIDDGAPLGASAVETALLKYALSHPNDGSMDTFNTLYGSKKDSNAYNQLLFNFRKAKEDFYGNKRANFSVVVDHEQVTSADEKHIDGFSRVSLSAKEVREILEGEESEKYIQRVKAFVSKFKEEHLKDKEVACVYLTGGASRMDFVREIFMNVFNLPGERCPKDNNPSTIVSQGIALLAKADFETRESERKMKAEAKEIIDAFDWDGTIRKIVLDNVQQTIIKKAKDIMLSYKRGDIYVTRTVKKGYTDGKFYGTGIPTDGNADTWTGRVKYRNVEALIEKINDEFRGFAGFDFVSACEDVIKESILSGVYQKLIVKFAAFRYASHTSREFTLSGLSARVSAEGANTIADKFTKEGDGHFLYEAVKSCYPFGAMVGWNLEKDRSDSNRAQHYDYYIDHYASIFDDSSHEVSTLGHLYTWKAFLNKYVEITGVKEVKEQVERFVTNVINEYISYAKLTQFFN